MARQSTTKRKAAAQSPSLWIVLLCLLPVIVLVWFLMQLEAGRDEVRRADTSRQRKPAVSAEQKNVPTKEPQPQYDFYQELPKASSKPPAAPPPKPEPAKKPAPPKQEVSRANTALRGEVPPPRMQYFLQAGSFRKVEDAERLRAKLALLGQVTRLEQNKTGEQIWYRVMIGPFSSGEKMTEAKSQLAKQGFKVLLAQKRQVNSRH